MLLSELDNFESVFSACHLAQLVQIVPVAVVFADVNEKKKNML